jgi:hypothetical protein
VALVHSGPVAQRDVGLDFIARRLGRRDAAIRTLVDLVRELMRTRGFPAPLGFRKLKGELIGGTPQAVCKTSRWPLAAVLAWFDQTFPTHAAADADAEAAEWANKLDASALQFGEAA